MNTRYDTHAPFAHPHRSHPVSLLSTAVASADKTLIDALAIHADVQLCAFYKWETAGKPSGNDFPFWFEAEQEVARQTGEKPAAPDGRHPDQPPETQAVETKQDTSGVGNSQDADRHSGIRHPHSSKI